MLADDAQWYRIDIGFNLGYPDRVQFQERAMQEVARLGIHDVRIYEIFNGKQGGAYQRRLKGALDRVLNYGMKPMLCISNTPPELQPDENEKERLLNLLPARVAKQTNSILKFSNRFPPNSLEQYKESLQGLLVFLFAEYGKEQVATWWFEIGNEPDAALYFWGTGEQFDQMFQTAIQVFHENGIPHVGGMGVTHQAIFLDDYQERNVRYKTLLERWAGQANTDEFISFHLYERGEEKLSPLAQLPIWLSSTKQPVMITEWNVSSRGEVAARIFERPGLWGGGFIRLLADCAKHDIRRVYLFGLADYPLQKALQLGAFDGNGQPKPWYHEFEAVWSVVRDGYKVEETKDSLIIRGKHGQFILLPLSSMQIPSANIIYKSQMPSADSKGLEIGNWIIVTDGTVKAR